MTDQEYQKLINPYISAKHPETPEEYLEGDNRFKYFDLKTVNKIMKAADNGIKEIGYINLVMKIHLGRTHYLQTTLRKVNRLLDITKIKEIMEVVDEILDTLPEKEKSAIIDIYGLEDGIVKSIAEVARARGVSSQTIYNLDSKASRRLGRPSRSRILRSKLKLSLWPRVDPYEATSIHFFNVLIGSHNYNYQHYRYIEAPIEFLEEALCQAGINITGTDADYELRSIASSEDYNWEDDSLDIIRETKTLPSDTERIFEVSKVMVNQLHHEDMYQLIKQIYLPYIKIIYKEEVESRMKTHPKIGDVVTVEGQSEKFVVKNAGFMAQVGLCDHCYHIIHNAISSRYSDVLMYNKETQLYECVECHQPYEYTYVLEELFEPEAPKFSYQIIHIPEGHVTIDSGKVISGADKLMILTKLIAHGVTVNGSFSNIVKGFDNYIIFKEMRYYVKLLINHINNAKHASFSKPTMKCSNGEYLKFTCIDNDNILITSSSFQMMMEFFKLGEDVCLCVKSISEIVKGPCIGLIR